MAGFEIDARDKGEFGLDHLSERCACGSKSENEINRSCSVRFFDRSYNSCQLSCPAADLQDSSDMAKPFLTPLSAHVFARRAKALVSGAAKVGVALFL